ncbi:uncharacterized protein AMSG_10772 [Thecamonas trahens ATCC 50062]|uniref:Uncharacterized protein n=1 Tax=Thecamonas trahens ATCC 50062 TaxID=461836 RepID=A0A0L0DSH6_THETB|nr:hypothetical protein AMSG_10772 [Thecamonas trahens ATCC 50062]KNC55162.1 hypothetical protein AMSG_10772 [Thecamonas trahens ATCC 50062]|eukprot:XP_013753216.1 hypothetical protein AMSG_10772 [Thecamonas trahens ATCC 50062]
MATRSGTAELQQNSLEMADGIGSRDAVAVAGKAGVAQAVAGKAGVAQAVADKAGMAQAVPDKAGVAQAVAGNSAQVANSGGAWMGAPAAGRHAWASSRAELASIRQRIVCGVETFRAACGEATRWTGEMDDGLLGLLAEAQPVEVPADYHAAAATTLAFRPGSGWTVDAVVAAICDVELLTLTEAPQQDGEEPRPELGFGLCLRWVANPRRPGEPGLAVAVAAAWRSPSLMAALALRAKRAARGASEPVTWETLGSALAEEVRLLREACGAGPTAWPTELFLLLRDAPPPLDARAANSSAFSPRPSYVDELAAGPILVVPPYNVTQEQTLRFAATSPEEALVEALASPLFGVGGAAGFGAIVYVPPRPTSNPLLSKVVVRIVAQWVERHVEHADAAAARPRADKADAAATAARAAFAERPVAAEVLAATIGRLEGILGWFTPPQTAVTLGEVCELENQVALANCAAHATRAAVEAAMSGRELIADASGGRAGALVGALQRAPVAVAALGRALLPHEQGLLAAFVVHGCFASMSVDERSLFELITAAVRSAECPVSEMVRAGGFAARLLVGYCQRKAVVAYVHQALGEAIAEVGSSSAPRLQLDPAAPLRAAASGRLLSSQSRTLPLRQQIMAIEDAVVRVLNAAVGSEGVGQLPPFLATLLKWLAGEAAARGEDGVGVAGRLLVELVAARVVDGPNEYGLEVAAGNMEVVGKVLRAMVGRVNVARAGDDEGGTSLSELSSVASGGERVSGVAASNYVYEASNPLSLMQSFIDEGARAIVRAGDALVRAKNSASVHSLRKRMRAASGFVAVDSAELDAVCDMVVRHQATMGAVAPTVVAAAQAAMPATSHRSPPPGGWMVVAVDQGGRCSDDDDDEDIESETGPRAVELLRDGAAMVEAYGRGEMAATEAVVSHVSAATHTLWKHRVSVAIALQSAANSLRATLDEVEAERAELDAVAEAVIGRAEEGDEVQHVYG